VPLIQSQKSFTFLFWLETAKPGLVQCEANFLHRVRHAGDDIRKYDQLFSLAKSELARRGALSAVDLDAPEDETGEDWKG
jgi:hypothetical protein